MTKQSYIIINLIFVAIIILIFAYSYIYVNADHPVKCQYKQKTGRPCPTCGISRSITSFTHLNFKEAANYNLHGVSIAIFFLIQLIMRVAFTINSLKTIRFKLLIAVDLTISVALFILCFNSLLLFCK